MDSSALRAEEKKEGRYQGLKSLATIVRPPGEEEPCESSSTSLFVGHIQL